MSIADEAREILNRFDEPDYIDPEMKEKADAISREARIEMKLDQILEKISATEAMVEKVVMEVKPTIDELMNSSLFKMLGMKKK